MKLSKLVAVIFIISALSFEGDIHGKKKQTSSAHKTSKARKNVQGRKKAKRRVQIQRRKKQAVKSRTLQKQAKAGVSKPSAKIDKTGELDTAEKQAVKNFQDEFDKQIKDDADKQQKALLIDKQSLQSGTP